MAHDYQISNAPALLASWGLFVSSLAANALPFVQIVALILSCVASAYVIRKNK